jgi:hypothetical protein
MAFWRKKMDVETFGKHLLWEFAKYGKGAESGVSELLESSDRRASVEERLVEAGVAPATRQRYQLFFTALMGQLAFHSLKERRLERLKAGFESEFAGLNQELAGLLGCPPADLEETRHFSALAADVIGRNAHFEKTGDLLNQNRGVENSLCEELGLLLMNEALAGCDSLRKGLDSAAKRSKCLRGMALTMVACYDEGAMHYKQYKLT